MGELHDFSVGDERRRRRQRQLGPIARAQNARQNGHSKPVQVEEIEWDWIDGGDRGVAAAADDDDDDGADDDAGDNDDADDDDYADDFLVASSIKYYWLIMTILMMMMMELLLPAPSVHILLSLLQMEHLEVVRCSLVERQGWRPRWSVLVNQDRHFLLPTFGRCLWLSQAYHHPN